MASVETVAAPGDLTASLVESFDYVVERLRTRLGGLSQDEYLWQPVQGCPSLRRGKDGRWILDGAGRSEPDGSRIATIAWHIGQLAGITLLGFTARLFADHTLAADTLAVPDRAEHVDQYVADAHQGWRSGLLTLRDEDLGQPLGPTWGPYAEETTLDLVMHVFDDVVSHEARVGLLRGLYPHLGASRQPPPRPPR